VTALPAGEVSWSQWLMWEERRLLARAQPVASSGHYISAFVDAGGQLLTCGSGLEGVLGQGVSVATSLVPRVVAGLGGVRILAVAVGGMHTLACSDEGVAYSFGYGMEGRLGHGDEAVQHTPKVIEVLQGVCILALSAGADHSLMVSETGELYTFGHGDRGVLGHGDEADQHTPRMVAALQGVRVSAVAAGEYHSLALSTAGEVYSFGQGDYGLLGHSDDVSQLTPLPITGLQGVSVCGVAAGGLHSLVVSTTGRLYSFGCRALGALGHGDQDDQMTPRLVEGLHGLRVLAVAAGKYHSLALSEAGEVYSFGICEYGKLGHGDMERRFQLTPRVIAGLQGLHVRLVAAGRDTSFAVTADGAAYGWGPGGGDDWDPMGDQPDPVLGLQLTEDQLVPCIYPGMLLHA
jgi:alpha-tubulin suppressor-like RCC1 family protein